MLWVLAGMAGIVLLIAAIKKKDAQHCSGITINIEGAGNNFFVDKKDVVNTLKATLGGNPAGMPSSAFDLRDLETELEKDVWVKSSQLFFDNNNRLTINVLEREPIARVFTTTGTTFYLDSSLAMLPLSEKFSARLPVFTSFPSDKMVLSPADSGLLKSILLLSMAIQKDTFRMALIDQVDITPQRGFELVPKIGSSIIKFGDTTNMEEKFYKLQLFYRKVIMQVGFNKYSEINLQFNGQLVAKKKGAADKSSDSLRTIQIMQAIAENAERQTNDSLHTIAQDNENNTTNTDIIQQSIQRDEEQRQPSENVTTKPSAAIQVTTQAVIVARHAAPSAPQNNNVPAKKVVVKPKVTMPKAVMPMPVKPANKPPVNEY